MLTVDKPLGLSSLLGGDGTALHSLPGGGHSLSQSEQLSTVIVSVHVHFTRSLSGMGEHVFTPLHAAEQVSQSGKGSESVQVHVYDIFSFCYLRN
jgi:hypothetical protein